MSTISGSAGMMIAVPRTGSRRLPFVFAGLVIVGAVGAIAIVLATADSDSGSGSSQRSISYEDIGAPSRQAPDAAAAAPLPPPTPPVAIDAAVPEPPASANDLEAKCKGYQVDRKWTELAQCADKLKALDPKRAEELATRAAEEAKAAPLVAAVEAAIADKNLKDAKTALEQVPTGSVQYTGIKRKYDVAEAQAIAELAAQLERAAEPDCAKHNRLLGKARTAGPPRIATEAARRAPCPPAKCDADALTEKGKEQFSASRYAEALASFEAAYACRPAAQLSEKAFVAACNVKSTPKAKLHWRQLPAYVQSRTLSICVRNGITEATLNAR
jgi:hypothetical protein